MQERVIAILSECLKIPETQLSRDVLFMDTYSWDSLRHMELIGSLEQAFSVEFTFDEIISLRSVADICHVLQRKGLGR